MPVPEALPGRPRSSPPPPRSGPELVPAARGARAEAAPFLRTAPARAAPPPTREGEARQEHARWRRVKPRSCALTALCPHLVGGAGGGSGLASAPGLGQNFESFRELSPQPREAALCNEPQHLPRRANHGAKACFVQLVCLSASVMHPDRGTAALITTTKPHLGLLTATNFYFFN